MDKFNLYSQLNNELNEFFTTKVKIAGTKTGNDVRFLGNKSKDYEFSQWETINLIDLYKNSKFESGLKDSEGQRKIFLNVCKFRADVAAKQIDLDVKNFNFVPDDGNSPWDAFFMNRDFNEWAKENYFGELINTWVEKYPTYGWIVGKEVNGQLEDVPLQTLRNQQDAKSLNSSRYVIIEHPNMTLSDMAEMPDWNTGGLDMAFNQTATVFERYGHVPMSFLKKHNPTYGEYEEGDEDKGVDAVAICILRGTKEKPDGDILFIEQLNKRPFVEAFWNQQHGRLMGIGEIENQFENQIGANLSFNFYRRNLLWSSKKIFQSPNGEGLNKNLVRDVKDGDVLEVGMNGNISQVNMANQSSADYNNFSAILEKNSDQKSFTYEVATGESLPSGTPFRLGVVLSNAVNSHFEMKREKLGLFLKKGIIELILPTWKKTFNKEHIISMFADEEGFEALKEHVFHMNVNNSVKEHLFQNKPINLDLIKTLVRQSLDTERYIFVTIPDNYYQDVKTKVTLTITGEEIDIPKKIETLTNLYTGMAAKGDPRAERVLARILAYAGENYDMLVGSAMPQSLTAPTQPANPANPNSPTPSPAKPSSLNMPVSAPAKTL